MNDLALVKEAQVGNQTAAEYLLKKYQNLVRSKVRSYFLVGAEREDLLQVGMIGLWQAIMDFKEDKATSFPAFAKVCVHNNIVTAIKATTRQKRCHPAGVYSLDVLLDEDDSSGLRLSDMVKNHEVLDPEEIVISKELSSNLWSILDELLSPQEQVVLELIMQGLSYKEVADRLGVTRKFVDNALSRVKRKAQGSQQLKDIAMSRAREDELFVISDEMAAELKWKSCWVHLEQASDDLFQDREKWKRDHPEGKPWPLEKVHKSIHAEIERRRSNPPAHMKGGKSALQRTNTG